MDRGSCHPHTPAQHQRKSAEVWLTDTFADYKKVLTLKKIWCTLNVLLTQPNTQMLRVQSPFRGALNVWAIIKTHFRIKSKTKEREMTFFSCLVAAMLCAVEYTKAVWSFAGNNGGEEWMHTQRTLLLPEHTSHICSVATPVPCWCEHMGKGRGSISSVKTGGEDFCCIIQSRAGLYKELNTLVNGVSSWHCSSV